MEPFDDLVKYAAKWAHSVLKSDGTDGDCLLFENPSDDVIIPMVGEALRSVTGNERVRYYSLRHSFASWTDAPTHLRSVGNPRYVSAFAENGGVATAFEPLPACALWQRSGK